MKVIVTKKARKDLIDLFEYNLENSVRYAIRIDQNIRLSICTFLVQDKISKHFLDYT